MGNVTRIRTPRNYNKNSVRLDMAERVENFENTIWERFKNEELSQLSVLAYPDYDEISALETRIAQNFGSETDNCIIDCGSDALIKLMIETFVKDSEVVFSLNPSFPMYHIYARVLGRKSYCLETDNNYEQRDDYLKLDINFLIEEIKSQRPKLVFLSNPYSPLGGYYSQIEVLKIADVMLDFGGILCLDEAYLDFVSPLAREPNAITGKNILRLRTFSKGWGAAGLRMGYAMAPPELINPLRLSQLTFPITGPSLKFINILLDEKDLVMGNIQKIIESRKSLINFFRDHNIEYLNSHTNSVHFRLDDKKRALFNLAVLDNDVKIRSGNATGTPVRVPNSPEGDWIRMSIQNGIIDTEWFKKVFSI